MYAAVLHTVGTAPRYEEFPEPVINDKDGEAIVHVHAASLKPVDKQLASGSHYASHRALPCVCGSDGVGHLDDGKRVFFGGPRLPHGAMAQRTVVPRALTFPVPANVSDETRFVQVGEGAASTITLPAAVLRSTALTILGTAGIPPGNVLLEAFQQVMAHAAKGELHIDTERVPLADIENAWQGDWPGRRLVIMIRPD